MISWFFLYVWLMVDCMVRDLESINGMDVVSDVLVGC